MTTLFHLGLSINHCLAGAVLAPAVAVAAYGVAASLDLSGAEAAAQHVVARQAAVDHEIVLKSADGHKALFATRDGLSLVIVGSPLDDVGKVASITMREGHWSVATTTGLVFETN
jgi:hypothetical protein